MALDYYTYLEGKTRPFSSWKFCSQPPKRRRRWYDSPVRNKIIHSEMIITINTGTNSKSKDIFKPICFYAPGKQENITGTRVLTLLCICVVIYKITFAITAHKCILC